MKLANLLEWAPMIAALAAVVALLWQIDREIRSVKKKEAEVARAAKVKIISDLVAHRFVLTHRAIQRGSGEAEAEFDAALSRIPVDFIEHPEVLMKYHELGNGFTPEKFHGLIVTMLEIAGRRVPEHFTVELLERVPTRSAQTAQGR